MLIMNVDSAYLQEYTKAQLKLLVEFDVLMIGTRFRPLFPLAGQPMVHHAITACKGIPNRAQIYLVGFYQEREFALYVSSISNELRVPVRYLWEDKPHGSAGGLYNFRGIIMEDGPSQIFLLNCDVCCSFPLPEMLEAHRRYKGMGTILVSKVSAESTSQFGELVADLNTNEVLHYTAKPETFVYFVRLGRDNLTPLAGRKQLYVDKTMDFWEQIKTPGKMQLLSTQWLGGNHQLGNGPACRPKETTMLNLE